MNGAVRLDGPLESRPLVSPVQVAQDAVFLPLDAIAQLAGRKLVLEERGRAFLLPMPAPIPKATPPKLAASAAAAVAAGGDVRGPSGWEPFEVPKSLEERTMMERETDDFVALKERPSVPDVLPNGHEALGLDLGVGFAQGGGAAFDATGNGTIAGYRFAHVPPGDHEIAVVREHLPADFAVAEQPRTIALGQGDSARADIAVTSLHAIQGRVFIDANGNGRRARQADHHAGAAVTRRSRLVPLMALACLVCVADIASAQGSRWRRLTIAIPPGVSFNVVNPAVSTTGNPNPFRVTITDSTVRASDRVHVSVKAEAVNFSGPGTTRIPASKVSPGSGLRNWRLATCDLRPATCDLRPATCDLRLDD